MSVIDVSDIVRNAERKIGAAGKLIGNNIRNKKSVKIGDPSTNEVYADENETLIYVQGLGTESGALSTISVTLQDKDHLIFGNPILIEQTATGQWVIDRGDPEGQSQFMAGVSAIPNQTPVNLNQLEYGTLHPFSGLVFQVLPAMYGNDYVGTKYTGDFATGTVQDTSAANIVIPTTNNRAIAVLVQMTASTGVLSYKQSVEFLATTSLESQFANGILPNPDSTAFRVGYIKLVKGVTSADYSYIWQVPELLNKSDGTFPISLDYAKIIATNTQIVVSDFDIASGGELTIDGRITII